MNIDPQNTTDDEIVSNKNPTKNGDKHMCFGRISSFCSTSTTRHDTLTKGLKEETKTEM